MHFRQPTDSLRIKQSPPDLRAGMYVVSFHPHLVSARPFWWETLQSSLSRSAQLPQPDGTPGPDQSKGHRSSRAFDADIEYCFV